MKKCPTCDKTFDDNMRFCQTDGTPLVEVAEEKPEDPYKTNVASKEEMSEIVPPVDPFATMVGGSMPKQEESGDLLQLPEEHDPMRTMVASDMPSKEPAGTGEKKENEADVSEKMPEPPKFSEPEVNPPSFGGTEQKASDSSQGSSSSGVTPPKSPPSFGDKPSSGEPSSAPKDLGKSPYGKSADAPIPSPFGEKPKFEPPPAKEPEKKASEPQSPFGQPSPFGEPEKPKQPLQQSEWSTPPAPKSGSGGQNKPVQPPATGGQNQTLALVSLILGILSLPCCTGFIFGIAAAVIGFIAKGKADENPAAYGGRSYALWGMILGLASIVLGVVVIIVYVFFFAAAMNF